MFIMWGHEKGGRVMGSFSSPDCLAQQKMTKVSHSLVRRKAKLTVMKNFMGTDIKSRFGTAIRTRRKRLGISQQELAGRAGLHRTYIADIERGARNLSLANIEKLAKGLGTTIPELFSQGEAPLGTSDK